MFLYHIINRIMGSVSWYVRIITPLPIMITLTHWGRVTHIWVSKFTITGSENGLLHGRHQAIIIWTNTGILLIGPLGTNFSEMLVKIYRFSFKKMHLQRLRNFFWSHRPKWPLLKFITSAIFTSHQSNLADVSFINIGHFRSILLHVKLT